MTSDAKIGLLLGLGFIFLIALIINGLPDFRSETDSNELTTNMIDRRVGFADRERAVSRRVVSPPPMADKSLQPDRTEPTRTDDARFSAALPGGRSVARETSQVQPPAVPQVPAKPQKEMPSKTTLSRQAWPKVYVVSKDDTLAVIAKKFYGREQGNKRVNVARIFEANRKLLKSPHRVYPGQKLFVPPLPGAATADSRIHRAFSSKVFEKVETVGQRHLPAGNLRQEKIREYVVRQDDNLWRIAAEQLGSGSRYLEIAKLNASTLEDEDNVPVGMRLKIPAQ